MDLTLIGATHRTPAAEVLCAPSGERFPLPLPADSSYAFDDGLDRVGWVVITVYKQAVALRDGDFLRPTRLPDAWYVLPAADPTLALLLHDNGDRYGHVSLIDRDGTELRTVFVVPDGDAHPERVVGELAVGSVVTTKALWSWDGERRPLPPRSAPRLDATGRFDADQLRAALIPAWSGPIPAGRRGEFIAAARESLGDAAADATPAIRLRSCIAPRRVAVGTSRFGGRPDLPRGMRWPKDRNGPMAFLAQLRCDELAAALQERELPTDGLLVVFAEVEHDEVSPDGTAHVELVPTDDLVRKAWPGALSEEVRFDLALAVAEPTLSPPATGDMDPYGARPGHQLFGHHFPIQGAETSPGSELLLQLEADPLVGTEYGDGGHLLFWMPAGTAIEGVLPDVSVDIESF